MMPASPTASTISIQDILRDALDGVFVIDRHRRFILFSEGCERITGYTAAELLGTECYCREVLQCRDEYDRPLSSALCPVKTLFERTARSSRQRIRMRRKNGANVWVETIYTPVHNEAGEVEFVLGVIRDVTDGKMREEQLIERLSRLRGRLRELSPDEQFETDFDEHPTPTEAAAGGETWAGTATTTGATGTQGTPSLSLDPILAEVEREAIRRALRSANWQRNKAAQLMGISRSRLYRRMEALGIDPNRRE